MTTKRIRRNLRKRAFLCAIAIGLSVTISGCGIIYPWLGYVGAPWLVNQLTGVTDYSSMVGQKAILSHAHVSAERLSVEDAFGRALRQFALARLYTEQLKTLNPRTMTWKEAATLVQKTQKAWREADEMIATAMRNFEIFGIDNDMLAELHRRFLSLKKDELCNVVSAFWKKAEQWNDCVVGPSSAIKGLDKI